MLFFSYRETLPYFTCMAVMGTCRPQCQNCQASVHGVRGNGNYLLEVHSCQYMHHFSTHYSIQVALPPTVLGKLKIEPKNTFHTLFWLLGAASRRGCLSWNNWVCLLKLNKTTMQEEMQTQQSAVISNKNTSDFYTFIVFCKLPFPLPISPCLPHCPPSFTELCSVSFLPQFNPSWSDLCDDESL